MAKYSDEERDAILRRSAELLSYDLPDAAPPPPELSSEEIVRQALAEPCESRSQRVTREIAEREALLMAERIQDGLVHKTHTPPPAVSTTDDAMRALEAKIDMKIANERQHMFDLLEGVIAELNDRAVADDAHKTIVDGLAKMQNTVEASFAKMQTAVDELRKRGDDKTGIVDLPNPISPRRLQ